MLELSRCNVQLCLPSPLQLLLDHLGCTHVSETFHSLTSSFTTYRLSSVMKKLALLFPP